AQSRQRNSAPAAGSDHVEHPDRQTQRPWRCHLHIARLDRLAEGASHRPHLLAGGIRRRPGRHRASRAGPGAHLAPFAEFSRNLRTGHWWRAFRQWRQLVRELRDRRYDLVVDFQGLMKSGLWALLSGGKRRVGFGPGLDRSEGSHWFYTGRVPPPSMEVHALERGRRAFDGERRRRRPGTRSFWPRSERRSRRRPWRSWGPAAMHASGSTTCPIGRISRRKAVRRSVA
ncbi:MAG: glycosyltransferase family 9 protein, partial [Candidatus Competibacteraceae bacterium]|nr:glycosyltransferase family 9 protein [Candidatus Competibacteraceae bacterium]